MKLYKAIKLKNQLIGQLKELGTKIQEQNTIVLGSVRNYSIEELINSYDDKKNCLIKVKTAIHLANNKVFHKICLLSELKLQASLYKRLTCQQGPNINQRSYREDVVADFDSAILMLDRDERVKELETKISNLQDELDEYNYNTEIEIVEAC